MKRPETLKRIINDLDNKKASPGVLVCVNEALKTGSFPDSLKCANDRPVRQIIMNLFSIKFSVDLEKHIVCNMLYLNY